MIGVCAATPCKRRISRRRLEPVENRDMAVHEDGVIRHEQGGLDGGRTICHDVDLIAENLEHCQSDLLVHGIVFDEEDAGQRPARTLPFLTNRATRASNESLLIGLAR